MTQLDLQFAAVHSVSDLHLGGLPDFQISNSVGALAAQIRAIPEPDGSTLLVLNGDIVDFLAEEVPRYLDPDGASVKLERIAGSPQYSEAFRALRDYLEDDRHHLAVVLGNHDVELALPAVQLCLRRLLAASPGALAASRLHFATDGAGLRCAVGGASVLFLHGNEFDPTNVVDHEALLEVSRAMQRKVPLPDWNPNFGTRLVVDAMNRVKATYRWVDLLKPEVQSVLPILLALDPTVLRYLRLAGDLGFRAAWGAAKVAGLLSAEEIANPPPAGERALLSAIQKLAPELLSDSISSPNEDPLARAERHLRERTDPLDLVASGVMTLGAWDEIEKRIGRAGERAIRECLRRFLPDDSVFNQTEPDALFKLADARVGNSIDFLVTGHTHFRKALRRSHGRGFYFNSGTWIDLIGLDDARLQSDASFVPVWSAMKRGSIEALAQCPGGSLIRRLGAMVSIAVEQERVVGRLRGLDADGKWVQLTPEQGFGVPRGKP